MKLLELSVVAMLVISSTLYSIWYLLPRRQRVAHPGSKCSNCTNASAAQLNQNIDEPRR
jgi:hypothetical protein